MKFSLPRMPFQEDKLFGVLALISLAVPLFFYFQLYEKFETIKISVWLILTGAAFWVLVNRKFISFKKNALVFWLVGIFLFFLLISVIFSPGIINSIFGSYPRLANGFLFYLLWAISLLLFLGLEKEKFDFLIKIFFFTAVIAALFGILQSLGIAFYEGLEESGLHRSPSLLGNPNFSSMFIVSILPLAIPLYAKARLFWNKLYYILGAVFILWATFSMSSRGAWLGLAAVSIIGFFSLIFFKFKKRFWLSLLAISIIGFFSWLGFLNITRPNVIASTFFLTETNVSSRLFVWDIAREAIMEKPLTGVGLGNFQLYFENHRGKNLADQSGVFDDTHNLFLNLASTAGLPALACFLGLIGLAIFLGYRNIRKEHNLQVWGLAIGLIAWVLMACFTPVSSANYLLLALFTAGLFANAKESRQYGLKFWAKGLLAIFGAVFMLFGVCLILSELLFMQGYLDYFQNRFAKSQNFIRAAIFLNPTNQMYYSYSAANRIFLKNQENEIQQDIARVIKLQPKDARSYLTTAKLYFLYYDQTENEDYLKQAILNMDKCLALDPLYAERYFRAGFYRAQSGQLLESLAYVKFGINLNQKDFVGWLLLARIYQLQDKQQQTLYALKQAYKLRPDFSEMRGLWKEAKENPQNYKKLAIPAIIDTRNIE